MSFVNDIINDTLKRVDPIDGKLKWSRTSLTMLSAWVAVLFAFVVDTIKHAGEADDVKFSLLAGVALGSKVADAYTKKITPPENEAK